MILRNLEKNLRKTRAISETIKSIDEQHILLVTND